MRKRLLLLLVCCGLLQGQGIIGISGSSGGGGGGDTANITDDLLHHYPFEQSSGTSVTDLGSAAENLALINTPTWSSTTPAVGSFCLDFDRASTEHAETADSPTLPTSGGFTYAVWARPDSNDSTVYVIMDGSGGNEFQLLFDNTDGLNTAFNNTTHSNTEVDTYSTGAWFHFAVVHDGSALFIYLNGRLFATRFVPVATLDFSTCQLLIGVDADATCDTSLGNYFNGQLDDFRIYSRALAAIDIRALYALGN